MPCKTAVTTKGSSCLIRGQTTKRWAQHVWQKLWHCYLSKIMHVLNTRPCKLKYQIILIYQHIYISDLPFYWAYPFRQLEIRWCDINPQVSNNKKFFSGSVVWKKGTVKVLFNFNLLYFKSPKISGLVFVENACLAMKHNYFSKIIFCPFWKLILEVHYYMWYLMPYFLVWYIVLKHVFITNSKVDKNQVQHCLLNLMLFYVDLEYLGIYDFEFFKLENNLKILYLIYSLWSIF